MHIVLTLRLSEVDDVYIPLTKAYYCRHSLLSTITYRRLYSFILSRTLVILLIQCWI